MTATRCPKCSGSLKEKTVRNQSARECTGCGGLWIDVDAMSTAAGKPMSLWSVVEAELKHDARDTDMPCPSCSDRTLQATDFQGAELDWCSACRGVFLDPGEMKAVAKSHHRPMGDVVGEVAVETAEDALLSFLIWS